MAEPGSRPERFTFATPAPDEPLYMEAFELGEANTRQLGMLPRAAWVDFASRGHVLVALDEGQFAGYAAYRLPRDRVTLVHLVVAGSARRAGAAKALVDELSRRHPDRRGILASCRRDYDAHAVWPKLGFFPLGDRPGRGRAGHWLTDWWLDHAFVDLLSWQGPAMSATPVAVDANIFYDLHVEDSPESEVTRAIMQTLEGSIDLLVTPELSVEINRQSDTAKRARLHQDRATYPPLPVRFDQMQEIYSRVVAELPRTPSSTQDISDARHVAYAIAAGVPVLVTRDIDAANRLRAAAQDIGGLNVVSPGELVVLIDSVENESTYAPVALMGTGYTMKAATDADRDDLQSFLDFGAGERRAHLSARLESLAAQAPASTRLLVRDPDGRPVGLLGTTPAPDALAVTLFRVMGGPLRATIAAQMASLLRPMANGLGRCAIRVTDPYCGQVVLEALAADGHALTEGGTAVALALQMNTTSAAVGALVTAAVELLPEDEQLALGAAASLARGATAGLASAAAAALEHGLRPLRILDAELPTWLVPIKPGFAADLLGWPEQLLNRPDELGVRIEHVYYTGARSGERSPGRILWYASDPESAVFACSELMEAVDGPPERLWRRFRRLGIYERGNVTAQANGRSWVRALRVTNTEILARPVPYRELRRLADRNGHKLRVFSPSRVGTGLFADIMGAAR